MKQRGRISFVFDDGYEHIRRDIVPLLEKHDLLGVFAIPLHQETIQKETGVPMATWQQWLPLTQRGHEIAAHSVTHRNLTTCTSDVLQKELQEPHTTLQANTLVYPGGAYNNHVVEAAKNIYASARTVEHGFESLVPQDPWRLKTINFSRHNFSVTRANLLAFWAYVTNQWLIETYHIIDDKVNQTHAISRTGFAKHVAFVARLPIAVSTIKEILT